ncbi:MAG: hypothetical protein ABIU54_10575 [Candidatus Eisenbacteria bacterium]
MRMWTVVWLGLIFALPAKAAPLEASRALLRALARQGHAQATLRYSVASGPGGAPRDVQATLAVEPPDRARLDVPATGERITLRRDGGEWLQPSMKQVVQLRSRHAVAALQWWRVLLGDGAGVRERRLPRGGFRLVNTLGPADSADVWLDRKGMPARLELPDGSGGHAAYRLTGWRFTRVRGEAAFHLATPPGYVLVDMP